GRDPRWFVRTLKVLECPGPVRRSRAADGNHFVDTLALEAEGDRLRVLVDSNRIRCWCIVPCNLDHVDLQLLEIRIDGHGFGTINARTVVDANFLAFEYSCFLEGSELNWVVRFVRWRQVEVRCSGRWQCARQRAIDDWRVVGRLVTV